MRIAVVGAGAVGGYYGGTLAKHGEQVTLICRGAHRDAIVRDGLQVSSHWGDFTVYVPATADPHEVGPVDLIIYAVKTYHNPEALPLIEPLLGAGTAVLSIQNGVESTARIAAVYGWEPVLAGTTYIDAARPAPGRIEQVGATARIVFGEQDGSHTPRAARGCRRAHQGGPPGGGEQGHRVGALGQARPGSRHRHRHDGVARVVPGSAGLSGGRAHSADRDGGDCGGGAGARSRLRQRRGGRAYGYRRGGCAGPRLVRSSSTSRRATRWS